jgi:hypothetical protein
MVDKKIIDFNAAKEPLVHRRRDNKAKKLRDAFHSARVSSLGQEKQKTGPNKSRKRKKKKNK